MGGVPTYGTAGSYICTQTILKYKLMGFNFKTLGGLIEIKYATGDDVDNLDDEELDYLQEELERLQAKVDAKKPKEKKKEQPKTIKEILNDNEIPYEVRMKYIIEAYRKDQDKWGKLAEYAKHLEAEVIRYKEIMVANGYTDNRIEEEVKPSKGNAELRKELKDATNRIKVLENQIEQVYPKRKYKLESFKKVIKSQLLYIEALQKLLDENNIPYHPKAPINDLEREDMDNIDENAVRS